MKKLLIGALAALTAATGVLATSGTAQAYGGAYHGGYAGGGYRGGGGYAGHGYGGWHGGGGGAAIVAGLAGLAIGAAIAQRHYGYAAPAYYGRGYAYGPPAYYAGPTYWGWYGGCRREWVWSPRWGGYRPIDACY